MKLGIVGLPNVGKSTLFNSLTKAGALSANYPFATIDPNVGIVAVPDERIVKLGELYHTKKVTPATIEFVDIAGLVKGASKGEGLGNQFLANIREVDAIVHVVRCFEDDNIIHVDGSVDPARDIETINLELIFSDIEILERRIAKIAKQAKMDKAYAKELELAQAVKAHLEDGKMARTFEVSDDEDEQIWFKNYNLLTAKPTIYAANVAEDDLADDGASNPHVAKVREMAKEEGAEVFVICAQIEQELADLDDDEKKEYLEDLGVSSSGLDKLVAASYSLLGLISFLTAGEDECRAWTIKKGTKAPQAAGKIHTDFERGFIKAEVVNYQDLLDNGSLSAAKEKGIVGMEGKEYVVIDTAGIRKRGKVYENIEKYSVLRAMSAIERSDVVLVVIDGEKGIRDQDKHVAGYAHEAGKGVVIVYNKWDAVEKDEQTMHTIEKEIRAQFLYLSYAPVLFVSALKKQRIHTILPVIDEVHDYSVLRIQTNVLNEVIMDAQLMTPPPTHKGQRLKIYYASQVSVAPPTFVLFVNDPELLHFSYKRYLENRLREAFGFTGTTLRILARERNR